MFIIGPGSRCPPGPSVHVRPRLPRAHPRGVETFTRVSMEGGMAVGEIHGGSSTSRVLLSSGRGKTAETDSMAVSESWNLGQTQK